MELEPDDPFAECTVSSAEDCIVSKLRWYRQGGEVSDRQWRDVLGVISAKRPALDLTLRPALAPAGLPRLLPCTSVAGTG